ncbi:MAG: YiiG family protein [Myxococcales bacterium]|nr:YiiG family protein [Myxococcales bacterium]
MSGRGASTIISVFVTLAVAGYAFYMYKTQMKNVEKQIDEANKRSRGDQVENRNLSPEDRKDDLLQQKLKLFIDCSNRVSSAIRKTYRDYRNGLGAPWEAGPTCQGYSVGLRYYTDARFCLTNLAKAPSFKPSLADLDAAGAQYRAMLVKLEPLLKQAHRYYDQKDYKDDGCKKGHTLHTQLRPLFETFLKADKALNAAIDKYNDALLRRNLAKVEKRNGRNAAYYKLAVFVEAKDLQQLLYRNANLQKPDVTAMRATLKRVDTVVVQFEKFVDSGAPQASTLSWMRSAALDYLKAAKSFVRRKESGPPFSEHELQQIQRGTGWLVEGSYGKVLYSYNQLVSRFNSTHLR